MQRAIADTLEGALAVAYQNNPQINSQRAATRATDEGVGIALSGYRPKVTASAQAGEQYLDTLSKQGGGTGYARSAGAIAAASYGVTVSQTLFNGFQTASRTRLA
jgi:outer membrane protein